MVLIFFISSGYGVVFGLDKTGGYALPIVRKKPADNLFASIPPGHNNYF